VPRSYGKDYLRGSLTELARRYAQSVADTDRHRDDRGLDLAEAVIAAAAEADSPREAAG